MAKIAIFSGLLLRNGWSNPDETNGRLVAPDVPFKMPQTDWKSVEDEGGYARQYKVALKWFSASETPFWSTILQWRDLQNASSDPDDIGLILNAIKSWLGPEKIIRIPFETAKLLANLVSP